MEKTLEDYRREYLELEKEYANCDSVRRRNKIERDQQDIIDEIYDRIEDDDDFIKLKPYKVVFTLHEEDSIDPWECMDFDDVILQYLEEGTPIDTIVENELSKMDLSDFDYIYDDINMEIKVDDSPTQTEDDEF